MRAVIGTNVFPVMASKYPPHHRLFQAFLAAVFDTPVTNDILPEDEEKPTQHRNEGKAIENPEPILNAPNSFFHVTRFLST